MINISSWVELDIISTSWSSPFQDFDILMFMVDSFLNCICMINLNIFALM